MTILYCILLVCICSRIAAQGNSSEIIKAQRADSNLTGSTPAESLSTPVLPQPDQVPLPAPLLPITGNSSNGSQVVDRHDPINGSNPVIPPALNASNATAPIPIAVPNPAASNASAVFNNSNQTSIGGVLVPPLNLTSLLPSGKVPDALEADQRLFQNQTLASRNHQYILRITAKCNAEIIDVRNGSLIWASNTTSSLSPCSLFLLKSGVLTILDRNLHQIWKSDSNRGQEPASLRLDDTGHLTITDMILSTIWKTDPSWSRDHMNAGEIVTNPVPLISSNRIYSLHVTDSCKLAIHQMTFATPIWSTNSTVPATKCRLSLDRFGVLSLQSMKGDLIWTNNYTAGLGDEPFQLRLLSNGTLMLTSSQVPVWLANEHGSALLV